MIPPSPPLNGSSEARDKVAAWHPPKFFFFAATVALVIAGLHFGASLLTPVACSALLAFVLDPLVSRLRRMGLPMFAAVTVVLCLLIAGVGATAVLVTRQAAALSEDLPQYQTTIREKLRALRVMGGAAGAFQGASRVWAVVESELEAASSAVAASAAAGAARARPISRVQLEPASVSPVRALADAATVMVTPLATVGLVIVLLAYVLAQRRELTDRLVRLAGGDLHRMADVLGDAGQRVSRFLVSQLLVNIGFGVVLAVGLWVIGVPAAFLWGALAALLRFVPYLGTLIAAAFPLILAFAVDPTWSMVLWTVALIVVAELFIINVVEPMAYSSSTGVSPVAILISAAFWVLVWGPIGLVLATPLTVCLVVLGRHLGTLKFLDVLLGAEPVFDQPTVLYQRLIGGDYEEAIDWCSDIVQRTSLTGFYAEVALPMLALAASSARHDASAEQRHRVQRGAMQILADLQADQPPVLSNKTRVLCIGLRSELDTLSGEMLAHALLADGLAAQAVPAVSIAADRIAELPLQGVQAVVLCGFQSDPSTQARFVCRRLRRRHPSLFITLAAWSSTQGVISAEALARISANAWATTPTEVASQLAAFFASAAVPAPLHEANLVSPTQPDADIRELLARTAQRAAEVFRVPLVSVVWRGGSQGWCLETAGRATRTPVEPWLTEQDRSPLAAVLSRNEILVIADTARAPEFAAQQVNEIVASEAGREAHQNAANALGSSAVQASGPLESLVAFAGLPMRDKLGVVRGALALHDATVRLFTADELALLAAMGDELRAEIEERLAMRKEPASTSKPILTSVFDVVHGSVAEVVATPAAQGASAQAL